MKKIVGYADKLSVAPGDKLNFMVSCEEAGDYDSRIVRLICGDSNPEGPGIKEEVIGSPANGTYRGRKQHIHSGSCVVVPASARFDGMTSFTLQAFIWPTLPLAPNPRTRPGLGPYQAIHGQWSEVSKSGYVLMLDQSGAVALRIGDGTGAEEIISTHTPLFPRHWYFVAATYDATSKRACVIQEPLADFPHADTAATVVSDSSLSVVPQPRTPFMIAAYCQDWHNDQPVAPFRDWKLGFLQLRIVPRSTRHVAEQPPRPHRQLAEPRDDGLQLERNRMQLATLPSRVRGNPLSRG